MYEARQNKKKVSRRISRRESNNKQNRLITNNVFQLVKSTVCVNNKEITSKEVMAHDHAIGGVSHAEQRSWEGSLTDIARAFDNNEINNVDVKFIVNSQICEACQNWFEETAYPHLVELSNNHQNKNFTLSVEVNNQVIRILGKDFTAWPKSIGAVEKITKLDRLKSYIISWGGLETDKFFYYKSDMTICNVNNDTNPATNLNLPVGTDFPIIDQLILSKSNEIEDSYNIFKRFQDTAMVLTGDRTDIDFINLEQKNKPQFNHNHR